MTARVCFSQERYAGLLPSVLDYQGVIMDDQWVVAECDEEAVTQLAAEADVSPIIARVLFNRGLQTADQVHEFLNPSLTELHDPFLLPDMEPAARRLAEAVRSGERICVHGDYDVDGVTGAALLVRTLRALGANVEYRLPHRKHDGYDIKVATVQELDANGVRLIVTCDCGINAVEAVERANELGIDVIISDHHMPGPVLPPAIAVVDPKRLDAAYPFPDLAGVGVAYKLAQALVRKLDSNEESFRARFVDLVTLGTVADVVPLLGENRAFVKHGLTAVAASKKVGIQTMLKASNLTGKPLSAYYVAFVLAPRINAVGRMDDATKALELLLTSDEHQAGILAAEMERHNSDRKVEQERIMLEAIEQVESKDLERTRVLVLAAEGWNTGVVGIAAGKISDMYGRPAILLSRDEQCAVACGSARSVDGFNLLEGLRYCDALLDRYGGHAAAAGVSLPLANLDAFEKSINAYAAEMLPVEELVPRILMDAELDPAEVTHALADSLVSLEPFGMGNPEPLFLSRAVHVLDRQRVGDGSHLRLKVRGAGSGSISCIAFGLGDLENTVVLGSAVDLCYSIRLNTYNGVESVQLVVKAIR
jgi:single-stranded-DNA-specific exonuclease